MTRIARVEIFQPDEIAIVHVMNRTVRRCFLMGIDPLTGKNYDHRKEWLEVELVRLAAQFGVDLLCQAILSNHFHLVLRSRPDVVATWDDTEVARRWLALCPRRKKLSGESKTPSEAELNTIRRDKQRLQEIRTRLSDISWWMRLLCQNIGQRANREDEEVGKFWQARFRAVRLLDEASLLACAAYVDLNPIRAAMAESLEQSDFTSIQKRIASQQAQTKSPVASADELAALPDGYLAPLEIDERQDAIGPCCHRHGRRCSDKGFLPIPVAKYVQLLDWTARQWADDKQGTMPPGLAPVFERLGIRAEVWCVLVKKFGALFYAVAGKPHTIDARRSRNGQKRYKAKHAARELLAA